MAVKGEGRTLVVVLLMLLGFANIYTDAISDRMSFGFNEEADYIELGDFIETDGINMDSSSTCDFTQFGSNHSAVLPPLDECEKFKLIAGEIYHRGTSEDDKQSILEAHNKLRNKVAGGSEKKGNPGPQPSGANLIELVWNDQLAVSAQGWANQCAVKHDKAGNRQTCEYRTVGQNVAHKRGGKKNIPSTRRWDKIVNNLYNEVKNMPDYVVDKLQKVPKGSVGHYTQLIWAKTREVGCGAVFYYLYKEKKGKLRKTYGRTFVCNYGPSGNFKGGQVYERGSPASNCENGVSTTYENLCAPLSE
ncbi:unnamed protein product [Meganyctiphanes norvegica]|uniref:SCP domain-containing protein n=1 Tax=Meganyctiphanes norvegica TaxID=48144 RepID=A0AAV2Q9H7_MEGNR